MRRYISTAYFKDFRQNDSVHANNEQTGIILFTGISDDVNPEKKRIFAHTVCRVGDTPDVYRDAILIAPQRRKTI